ncbi:MAG: DUF1549 and DUF1553 domain-containing protein [Pseudomonadota bacterium]
MKLWKRVSLVMVASACNALALGAALAAGAAGSETVASGARARRAAQPAVYWAYRPITRPAVPEVKHKDWVRTPVDNFVLARLEEKGLSPSPEADRATFARRIYLDVLGLIPTPEQVKEFVEDRSPDAYEKLVDRLLASPHYGERIGRKWLDLARYADTQGYQDDEARPGAWRYRDYVIRSFNEDKPFDRFIREQIAGDELWPDSQEARVATGFLRNYPDGPDHRDMLERRYNSITDMTDTVGSVFLGHSLECARCHDHKFDRISQKEYFQFQAFFANTLPSDTLPVTEKGEFELAYERARAAWEEATAEIRREMWAFIEPYREEIDDYHYTRFYENAQVSLRKPKEQWTSLDRWVNYRYQQYIVRNNPDYAWDVSYFAAANGAFRDVVARDAADPTVDPAVKQAHIERAEQFRELLRRFRQFDHLKPVQGATIISGVFENGTDAAPQYIYMGGNHERPLEEVEPGFPAAITPHLTRPEIVPTANSSGRRTALANWLASPENPLPARVFVNRVWEMLFADGIVVTPSDIGRASQPPGHPELLDYLAARFIEQGWSVKKLQREILLSATYRQSSAPRPDAEAVDPQNRLLAKYPRRRMDAEQIRDSLLAASGLINLKQGGPAVYPSIPASVMKESTRRVEGFWPVSRDIRDHYRRSIYVFTRRSVPFPMLEVFDRASPQVAHARREVSTTPQQSLTLFNNDVVYGWSQELAARAKREAARQDEPAQIERLFQILFARLPDENERAMAREFLDSQQRIVAEARRSLDAVEARLRKVANAPEHEWELTPREQAFVDLAHSLANSNEFIYRY